MLAFLPRAVDDAVAARDHIEAERPGHGVKFTDEVRRCVERATRFPASGPRVVGLEPWDVRRFGLTRFPYSVVTANHEGERVVLAVMHDRRSPDELLGRLR